MNTSQLVINCYITISAIYNLVSKHPCIFYSYYLKSTITMVIQRSSDSASSWKNKVTNAINRMFSKNKQSLTKLRQRRSRSAVFSGRVLPDTHEGSTPLIKKHTRLLSITYNNDLVDGQVLTENDVDGVAATSTLDQSEPAPLPHLNALLLDGCNTSGQTSSSSSPVMYRRFISTSSVGSVRDFLQSIGSPI